MSATGSELGALDVTRTEVGATKSDLQFSAEMLALFNAHLDLVNKLAKVFSRHVDQHIPLQELVAAGREGLFQAARRFDVARGVPFHAYANYRIRGAILDGIRNSNRMPRRVHERLRALESATLVGEGEADFVFHERVSSVPEAEAEGMLDEHLASIATAATVALRHAYANASVAEPVTLDNPEDAYAQAELLAIIQTAVGDLDEIESKIIDLMYFEGLTLAQASQALGVSKPWACRLHARAMDRLTRRLRHSA